MNNNHHFLAYFYQLVLALSTNISLNNVKAPIKVGDIVGKINVIENNKTIMTIDVTVKEDINKANIFISYLRNLKDIVSGNI